MVDITIKEIPQGVEQDVLEMARIAVIRFKERQLIIPKVDISSFDIANNLNNNDSAI